MHIKVSIGLDSSTHIELVAIGICFMFQTIQEGTLLLHSNMYNLVKKS